MSCERPCEKKCRKDCEKRQGGSGGTNVETCRIESKKVCDIKCGNLPKPGPCISKCVEEKAKVCAFLSQEEAQSEQACRLKCGRHLCVNNKCTCSIYYTGDPLCMTPTAVKDMLPPRYAHCATPYSDGRFGKREGKNVTILSDRSRSLDFVRNYHKEYMSSLGLAIKRDPDVKDLIDFSTCAVVGSSNTLLGSDLGPEIDSHSAIIRFNDAKTMGYQQDVGSQNQPQDPERHFKGTVLTMSWRLLDYVQNFWPRKLFPGSKDTSAGFLGILIALHHCGTVDIYGFNQKSGHY